MIKKAEKTIEIPLRKLQMGFVAVGLVILAGVVWGYVLDIDVKPSQRLLSLVGKSTPAPSIEPTIDSLKSSVIPEDGYTVDIKWGDVGIKLIDAGGIDMNKYTENYKDAKYKDLLSFLTNSQNRGITINSDNAYFWVNTLWAIGLTQKSKVLDEGVIGTKYADDIGSFASTGGWTLGVKDAVSLYSSADLIPLTDKQQDKVVKISKNIYRPCCGNPTSFPDCNHGMAILGLIELMVSQGFSEEEIYKASLAFNSYWFPQTYLELAYYFQKEDGTAWSDVDAKRALSAEFSSAQGYQAIKKEIGNIPGLAPAGGSCGA